MAFITNKNRRKESEAVITPETALAKLQHYCAYQERCHADVKEKLYGFGLTPLVVDNIIVHLIEENYLNEERFAILYAGGHFRTKKWGRLKILRGLKEKGISEYCIKKAIREIDMDDYNATLQKLAGAKWELLRGNGPTQRKAKCWNYLVQKGYEPNLVGEVVSALSKL